MVAVRRPPLAGKAVGAYGYGNGGAGKGRERDAAARSPQSKLPFAASSSFAIREPATGRSPPPLTPRVCHLAGPCTGHLCPSVASLSMLWPHDSLRVGQPKRGGAWQAARVRRVALGAKDDGSLNAHGLPVVRMLLHTMMSTKRRLSSALLGCVCTRSTSR